MPYPTLNRVQMVVSVAIVALLAAACSQSATELNPKAKPTVTRVNQPLPAMVNGVPLLDLAKHALGAAEAYSVSKPVNVRVVVTTQAALYAQVPAAGGADRARVRSAAARPIYLRIVRQGHSDLNDDDDRSLFGSCLANGARATHTTYEVGNYGRGRWSGHAGHGQVGTGL